MRIHGYINGITYIKARPIFTFMSSWNVSRRMEFFQRFDKSGTGRYYGGWDRLNEADKRYVTLKTPYELTSAVSYLEYQV